MTRQQKITVESAAPIIADVPLADLYLSDLNPRRSVSEAQIESLAENSAKFGLIHNLAGLKDNEGKVAIVAGGCRLRPIQKIAEADAKSHTFAPLPVRLAVYQAQAEVWASAEKAAHEDMAVADEIRAFGRMRASGASVPDIAIAFAATEARGYQRLALAGLPEPALDASASGEISLGAAKAVTVSNDEGLTLRLLDEIRGHSVSEAQLKSALQPEAVKATDRRVNFIGIEAHEKAGGAITRDLFSEDAFLASPALLDQLFNTEAENHPRRFGPGRWLDMGRRKAGSLAFLL